MEDGRLDQFPSSLELDVASSHNLKDENSSWKHEKAVQKMYQPAEGNVGIILPSIAVSTP
ncbi:hypothetical protein KY289_000083 [Solanum tuberosum]|nr:hypothetical protein KY289_000083 [Solanum tuberosum]